MTWEPEAVDASLGRAALSEAAWYNIGLVVVVAALIVAGILAYRVYGEVNEDVDPASPEELLAAFEQARAEGELDEEEYERVRRRFDASLAQPPDSSTSAARKRSRIEGWAGSTFRPRQWMSKLSRSWDRAGLMPVFDWRMNVTNSTTSGTVP